jgi:hypothetical protein
MRGRQSIILDPNLKGRRMGGQPSGLRPSFVFANHLTEGSRFDVYLAVKFLQIWVFSRYLEAAHFPFSCLFSPFAVKFLKSKTAGSALILTHNVRTNNQERRNFTTKAPRGSEAHQTYGLRALREENLEGNPPYPVFQPFCIEIE